MRCKCLDTRYAKRTSSDRLGHDLNNPYMQDNDLKHMTMATSAIRNNNKKKKSISAIAIRNFGIS